VLPPDLASTTEPAAAAENWPGRLLSVAPIGGGIELEFGRNIPARNGGEGDGADDDQADHKSNLRADGKAAARRGFKVGVEYRARNPRADTLLVPRMQPRLDSRTAWHRIRPPFPFFASPGVAVVPAIAKTAAPTNPKAC
jgi:hypothetical protein